MALNDRERRREKKKKKKEKNNVSQSFSLTRNKTQCPLLFREEEDGEPKRKEIINKKIKETTMMIMWQFGAFQCQDRHNKSCLDSGKNL
jgi:hypothetical protein